MRRKKFAAAVLLIASGLPALAQPACGPRDKLLAQIKGKYAEERKGIGTMNQGTSLVELYVSPTGSWTVLFTDTRGNSCVSSAGEGWHEAAQEDDEL